MTTPNFGLPYPALSFSPDGPTQIKALADAVDAALTTEASTRSTADATNARTSPRLVGARLVSNANVTSLADVAGCTVTFSTTNVNTSVQISAVIDAVTTAGNYCEGVVAIDGVDQPQKFHAESDGIGGPDSATQVIAANLAAIGSHTIKLRAIQSGGTTTLQAQSTGISVLILGP